MKEPRKRVLVLKCVYLYIGARSGLKIPKKMVKHEKLALWWPAVPTRKNALYIYKEFPKYPKYH